MEAVRQRIIHLFIKQNFTEHLLRARQQRTTRDEGKHVRALMVLKICMTKYRAKFQMVGYEKQQGKRASTCGMTLTLVDAQDNQRLCFLLQVQRDETPDSYGKG